MKKIFLITFCSTIFFSCEQTNLETFAGIKLGERFDPSSFDNNKSIKRNGKNCYYEFSNSVQGQIKWYTDDNNKVDYVTIKMGMLILPDSFYDSFDSTKKEFFISLYENKYGKPDKTSFIETGSDPLHQVKWETRTWEKGILNIRLEFRNDTRIESQFINGEVIYDYTEKFQEEKKLQEKNDNKKNDKENI